MKKKSLNVKNKIHKQVLNNYILKEYLKFIFATTEIVKIKKI